jgi:hydroxyacylglutathione hydrolase
MTLWYMVGDGEEMHTALNYLATLPDDTVVLVGHEYTKDNLAFAKSVDPENKALDRLGELVKNKITTGRSTIGDEKDWNVFMRLETDAIKSVELSPTTSNWTDWNFRTATKSSSNTPLGTVMTTLREMKNNFKA